MQTKIINILLGVIVVIGVLFLFKDKFTSPADPVATHQPNSFDVTQTTNQLPKIPNAEGKFLFDNCSYVDVTFNKLPFSMSIDNQAGIRSNLALIDASSPPPVLNAQCQALGTIYYDVDAKTVLAADIMFGDGCNYFVFKKGGQPVYANRMTSEAVTYFTNIITQVKVKNE